MKSIAGSRRQAMFRVTPANCPLCPYSPNRLGHVALVVGGNGRDRQGGEQRRRLQLSDASSCILRAAAGRHCFIGRAWRRDGTLAECLARASAIRMVNRAFTAPARGPYGSARVRPGGCEVLDLPLRRRQALALGAAVPLLRPWRARAAGITLTIAYNVSLPTFDPTVGGSAVNPTIQSLYQSVFDPYVAQAPDLAFTPGLLTKWGWNADRTKIALEVRSGAVWHDGSPRDAGRCRLVARARRRRQGRQSHPVHLVDHRRLLDRRQYDHRHRQTLRSDALQVGWPFSPATSCRRPTSTRSAQKASSARRSAPARTPSTSSNANAFLRLKANPKYWGGAPAYDTVVFKFVPDASARIAEIESGASDVTLEIPYEEFGSSARKTRPRSASARRSRISA